MPGAVIMIWPGVKLGRAERSGEYMEKLMKRGLGRLAVLAMVLRRS